MIIFTTNLRRIPENIENIAEADLWENSSQLKNPKKEDLTMYIETPQGGEILKTTIMGGSGGAYHIGFTPELPGV